MGLATSKQEAFWEACGFGHVNRVRRFIEEGTDVNWVSYTHNSCAIHVASQGKPEIVKMLIDAKCNVNAKDDRGNLALHHAAMKGHSDIMQMLIDAGSEINTQDKNGWTPLLNAAYFCQPDAVETLIKNNCDVNIQNKDERTALHEACRSQTKDENGLAIIVCHLVEANSDINAKSSDVGEADFTPLMFAAYHGHADVAEVLAEAGCDINAQGSNGWTALHWAADRGHKNVAQVLLNWGIDPLIEGRRGELAADRAQDNSLKELLLEATSRAKNSRDIDNMVTHSPVSTTSPLSSSCNSSVASNIDNMHNDSGKNEPDGCVIDNDLVSKLEAIATDREASEQGADSSCTSGTISEKDEKETLEKEVSQNSQSCASLPEDGTAVAEEATTPDSELPIVDEFVGNSQQQENDLETQLSQEAFGNCDNLAVSSLSSDSPCESTESPPNKNNTNGNLQMIEQEEKEDCLPDVNTEIDKGTDVSNKDINDQVSEINRDTPIQVSELNPVTNDKQTVSEFSEVTSDHKEAGAL